MNDITLTKDSGVTGGLALHEDFCPPSMRERNNRKNGTASGGNHGLCVEAFQLES